MLKKPGLIWGNLVHLSYNMWSDRPVSEWGHLAKEDLHYVTTSPVLRFLDDTLWNDILKAMSAAGMNMVVIDVGDGIQYKSHPEISVKNAWSHKRLKQELAKARGPRSRGRFRSLTFRPRTMPGSEIIPGAFPPRVITKFART